MLGARPARQLSKDSHAIENVEPVGYAVHMTRRSELRFAYNARMESGNENQSNATQGNTVPFYRRPIGFRAAGSLCRRRVIPMLKRLSSRSTTILVLLLVLSIGGTIWSFHYRVLYAWLVPNARRSVGFIAGHLYYHEFEFIGTEAAFEHYRSQGRTYLQPHPKHKTLIVSNLPVSAPITKLSFLPDTSNVPVRVYHNNCDHADGIACILDGTSLRDRGVSIPIMLLIHLILIAMLIIFARRNYRRTRPGCCRRCGYSMIGNESGVCPECGSKKGANPMDAAAALHV